MEFDRIFAGSRKTTEQKRVQSDIESSTLLPLELIAIILLYENQNLPYREKLTAAIAEAIPTLPQDLTRLIISYELAYAVRQRKKLPTIFNQLNLIVGWYDANPSLIIA